MTSKFSPINVNSQLYPVNPKVRSSIFVTDPPHSFQRSNLRKPEIAKSLVPRDSKWNGADTQPFSYKIYKMTLTQARGARLPLSVGNPYSHGMSGYGPRFPGQPNTSHIAIISICRASYNHAPHNDGLPSVMQTCRITWMIRAAIRLCHFRSCIAIRRFRETDIFTYQPQLPAPATG